MCSICGIVDFTGRPMRKTVEKMNPLMKHRGPDESDIFEGKCACFGHNRLSVVDIENGHQPMSAYYGNKEYTIVYNGEIYNCAELRSELEKNGFEFKTNCDTEVVLWSYIIYGEDCPKMLNGIFSFAVYDIKEKKVRNSHLFLYRIAISANPICSPSLTIFVGFNEM